MYRNAIFEIKNKKEKKFMRIASKKRMRVVKDEGKTEDAVQRKRATRGFTWWRQWRRSVARGESYYFILIAMNNAAECNVVMGRGRGDVDQRGAALT